MFVLQSVVAVLGSYYDIDFDAEKLKTGDYKSDYFIDVSAKLLGSIGAIVATWNRIKNRRAVISPSKDNSSASNFMQMLYIRFSAQNNRCYINLTCRTYH